VDGQLAQVAAAQRGFVYRWQAIDCGYRDTEISALLKARDWVRIRRGAYALRAHVESLDAAGRHVLAVRAVVNALQGRVVVTHYSALAVMGVPLWGVDLHTVHVHRDGGRTGRTDAHVVHHVGPLGDTEVVEVAGLRVSSPERSIVDATRIASFEAGVVLADGLKRQLGFDDAVARDIVERQRDWAGARSASRVLWFADGAAETVGESRSRVLLARIGLPKPVLQMPFRRSDGTVFARSDFYFEEFRTAGEFDGRTKYGRTLYEKSGRLDAVDLTEVLWEEKRREDAIRDQGNEMVRWVWSELDGHDRTVRDRFLAAFDRHGSRHQAVG
jgi:hypothetical protein